MNKRNTTARLIAAFALTMGMGTLPMIGGHSGLALAQATQSAPAAAAEPKVGDTVVITLANGTTVEGVVTVIDNRQIKIQRVMAGGIKADVGYQRTEIRSLTLKLRLNSLI